MKKLYTLCFSLIFGATLSVAQIDVGVIGIPTPANNATIDSAVPTDFYFDVENFGQMIPQTDTLFFEVNIDGGNPTPFIFPLTLSGSDFNTNDVLNLYAPGIPITGPLGPFTLCVWTVQPNDITQTNDTACNNYTLGPPPVGISEYGVSLNKVFYSDEQLTVNLAGYSPNSEVNLSVMNISGQVVKNEKFTISKSKMTKNIPMAGLSKGIYIVALYSESRPVQTQKIMVH